MYFPKNVTSLPIRLGDSCAFSKPLKCEAEFLGVNSQDFTPQFPDGVHVLSALRLLCVWHGGFVQGEDPVYNLIALLLKSRACSPNNSTRGRQRTEQKSEGEF